MSDEQGPVADRGGKTAFFQDVRPRLQTLAGAKDFYSEVLERYSQAEISERNLRALVYALAAYLPYIKHEDDLRIETRLEALEKQIGGNG